MVAAISLSQLVISGESPAFLLNLALFWAFDMVSVFWWLRGECVMLTSWASLFFSGERLGGLCLHDGVYILGSGGQRVGAGWVFDDDRMIWDCRTELCYAPFVDI